jgi:hypothetical protein
MQELAGDTRALLSAGGGEDGYAFWWRRVLTAVLSSRVFVREVVKAVHYVYQRIEGSLLALASCRRRYLLEAGSGAEKCLGDSAQSGTYLLRLWLGCGNNTKVLM